MRSFLLIGLGSGLASALLFYSSARGSPALSAVLFLLAPLPLLVAGLGWGWLSAAVAAAAGSLVVGVPSGLRSAVAYSLAMGLPAVLIAYLAYLSRPDPYDDNAREWYPAGRLMAAVAIYAGALPVLILPLIGGSYESMRRPLAQMLQRAEALGMKSFTEDQAVAALPAAFSASWLIVFTLNLYLAGRVVLASGRLGRDWPDLPASGLPCRVSIARSWPSRRRTRQAPSSSPARASPAGCCSPTSLPGWRSRTSSRAGAPNGPCGWSMPP
jgi:hypothetical protein